MHFHYVTISVEELSSSFGKSSTRRRGATNAKVWLKSWWMACFLYALQRPPQLGINSYHCVTGRGEITLNRLVCWIRFSVEWPSRNMYLKCWSWFYLLIWNLKITKIQNKPVKNSYVSQLSVLKTFHKFIGLIINFTNFRVNPNVFYEYENNLLSSTTNQLRFNNNEQPIIINIFFILLNSL